MITACSNGSNPVEHREKTTVCTEEYAPVCDADGNIYGNTCLAVAAGALVSPSCHVGHLDTPIETSHPYANNQRLAWSVEAPAGATKLRVEFDHFNTEQGYDFVRVFGGSDQVAQYSGDLGTFLSDEIPGNRASIVLNTDGSVTRDGFAMYRYAYFTACACRMRVDPVCGTDFVTYDNVCEAQCEGRGVAFHRACEDVPFTSVPRPLESDHPYANNTSRTWIVTEGGTFIRGHFASLDLEQGYDFLEILDANDQVVVRYSGSHQDVTTPTIPGGVFKIRLVSDYSVTANGFVLDSIAVAGGCLDGDDCAQGQGCHQVQCVRAPCFQMCVDCPVFTLPPPWWCDGGVVVPKDGPDGCALPPGCERKEGALCGGEHEFQCNDGYTCVNGTCRQDATECYVGGCSGEVCSDQENVITTCAFMPWYGCYRDATCGVQAEGNCGWTVTPELEQCLRENGAPGYEAGENEPCGGPGDTSCKDGLECDGRDPNLANSTGICRKICGPIAGGFCPADYFCDIRSNAGTPDVCERLGRIGLCQPVPTACPRVDAPVCGCDGVTYTNDCYRQLADVALDHDGSCVGDNTCDMPSDCDGQVHIMCAGEWACVENLCEYHCDIHAYTSQDTPLAIPDAGSVRSVITAGNVGVIERLSVSVDITHTWRGDLIVELSKQGAGTTYVLQARTGGSADDLHLVNVPVTAFTGQLGDGEWTLTVTDAATWDTGTLNSWSIDIN